METYLIQRGKFEDRSEFKKGIDALVRFDYMGSAEFEFGALPKSLGNIRNELNLYVCFDVEIKNKVITVFCKDSQRDVIKTYLREIAEYKMHLKERTNFDEYIKGEGYFKDRTDFWWDIENDLMFWKKNEEFETKLKDAMANKPI